MKQVEQETNIFIIILHCLLFYCIICF